MKITFTETVTTTKEVQIKDLHVIMGGQKDIDSTNFEVYYGDIEIAYGHLNNKTNFAHVSLINEKQNGDIGCDLVHAIENRTIAIN